LEEVFLFYAFETADDKTIVQSKTFQHRTLQSLLAFQADSLTSLKNVPWAMTGRMMEQLAWIRCNACYNQPSSVGVGHWSDVA